MALPSSTETERNRYLMDLVRNASEPIIDWPAPNRDHVVLIGKIVMLYSYIDFNLRRMIEVLDHAKALPSAWLGKTAKMHLSDIETILETAPDIAPNNALALGRIKEFRKLRNLLAHFAVKRFPAEDALVFVTKSAADYKRVLGAEADPGVVMTAVADLGQIRDVCRMIEEIQHWLSAATNDLENAFLKSKTSPA
ncbi:hypothetical protein ABIB82_007182 [Bradyrhizobium sp. i1.8.4]